MAQQRSAYVFEQAFPQNLRDTHRSSARHVSIHHLSCPNLIIAKSSLQVCSMHSGVSQYPRFITVEAGGDRPNSHGTCLHIYDKSGAYRVRSSSRRYV